MMDTVTNSVQWFKKRTMKDKNRRRIKYNEQLALRNPTRANLHDRVGALKYCNVRGLSDAATRRVIDLVIGVPTPYDWSDYRCLPMSDRVPRSLYMDGETTPPGYWDITDPCDRSFLMQQSITTTGSR